MNFIRKIYNKKILRTVFVVFLISIFVAIPNAFFYTLNYFSQGPDETTNVGGVLGVTDSSPIANFPQTDGEVKAMALSEDGNILYIGGSFSSVTDSIDTYTRNNLAAIDLSTLTVTSWDPNANDTVYAIEVSGSNVFVGGAFTSVGLDGSGYRIQFAKLNNTTGEADTSCYPYVYYYDDDGCQYCQTVYSIVVSDGYIYVGGHFDRVAYDGVSLDYRNNLLRFNDDTNCSLDSWNPDPNGTVYSMEKSGEDLFIGGSFGVVGDESRSEFAKLSSIDGSVDESCNPNFWTDEYENTSTVYSINVSDEYIYVGGSFDKHGGSDGTIRNEVARLNNDTSCSLDDWNPNISHTWNSPRTSSIMTSESDIFLGGTFDAIGDDTRNGLALVDSESGVASTWDPNLGDGNVKDMIISDNYLIIGGYFETIGESSVANLAAFPYTSSTGDDEIVSTVTTTPASSGPEVIQIPEMTTNLQGPMVINPLKDSNTDGQEVIAVVFPGVFNFDAYFSANKINSKNIALSSLSSVGSSTTNTLPTQSTTKISGNTVFAGGGDSTILGVKKGGSILWQIGNVEEMWLKAYPAPGHDAARIIPELQEKDSIIALKYKKSDLVPPGFPNTKFSELKLKIGHSLDGKTWTTLPTSVVDPITNTVAAIGKIGGYYMIVGGY